MNIIQNLKERFFPGLTKEPTKVHSIEAPISSVGNPKFKGIMIKDEIKFPKDLGEEHPFDFIITEGLYKKYPIVFGMIDKFLDFMLGPGIRVTSENQKARDIIEQWISDSEFNYHLRKWAKEAFIKGTGFMELANSRGNIGGLRVLDAKWMYIKRDDVGYIEEYNQYIGKMQNFSLNKITSFKPNECVHIAINPCGDSEYGMGLVYPLLGVIDKILQNEKSMAKLMERKANAPMLWKVGYLNQSNPQMSIMPSEEVLNNIENKLTHINEKTEWVTGPDHNIQTVDFGNIAEKYEKIFDHYGEALVYGSQIPEVLFGSGSIPEGLAKEQKKAFERRIQALQLEFEKVIESRIFRQILQSNGIDDHVEVHWGEPDEDVINEKINQIRELLKVPVLEPSLSFRLQKELVELMGFEDDTLPPKPIEISDEAQQIEREQEEEEEEMPPVPGSNRTNNSANIKEDYFDYITDNGDYTLKEWLGFNYDNYKDEIISQTEKDKFEFLSAKTQEQLEAGLLDENQVAELKTVMKEGFENEQTIREIEKNINSRVAPGNRYKLDVNGNLMRGVRGERILAITSKARSNIIARTETIRLANAGAKNVYKKAGVEKYKWVAANSDRTCSICMDIDGQMFNIDAPVQPPAHVMCRCTVVPVIQASTKPEIKEIFKKHFNKSFFKKINDEVYNEYHSHEKEMIL